MNTRDLNNAVKDLIANIRSAKAVRDVRRLYDEAQGNADPPEGSTEEEAEWYAHEYALGRVMMFLDDNKLLPAESDEWTSKELYTVVDYTFTEIT